MDFMLYKYAPPPNPPNLPPGICSFFPNYCHLLHEPNFFDKTCFSSDDKYGGLGCNAGGLICCRFCEFRQYSKVPCIQSPAIPPYPRFPPASPPCPPSPPPPPSSPPPNNPLIVKIGDKIKKPTESKVNFHMRLDANIESIDPIKIKDKLRKVFKKIPKHLINIHFRPGSLIVDVSILTNITIIQNTTDIINEYNSTTLGNLLNMTIIEMSPPVIETYIADPISLSIDIGIYIFGAIFGAFGCIVIIRVLMSTCKCDSSINLDDSKTKKIEISNTSDISDITKERRQTLEDLNKFMGVDHHRTRLHSWHFENMGNIEA